MLEAPISCFLGFGNVPQIVGLFAANLQAAGTMVLGIQNQKGLWCPYASGRWDLNAKGYIGF